VSPWDVCAFLYRASSALNLYADWIIRCCIKMSSMSYFFSLKFAFLKTLIFYLDKLRIVSWSQIQIMLPFLLVSKDNRRSEVEVMLMVSRVPSCREQVASSRVPLPGCVSAAPLSHLFAGFSLAVRSP
jgi:hypothetical protein